jgi:hypothetical protein
MKSVELNVSFHACASLFGLCVTDRMSFYCLCVCIFIRKDMNTKRPVFVLSVISADGRLLSSEKNMIELCYYPSESTAILT